MPDDGLSPPSMLSSSSISSPPLSPRQLETLHVAAPKIHDGVTSAAAPAAAAFNSNQQTTPAVKPKRKRKPKELGPDGKPVDDGKPKKPRKPREPKEKATSNGTSTPVNGKKKVKTEDKRDATQPSARQSTITEMVTSHPVSNAPAAAVNVQPTAPRPANSGQRYDPIRGVAIDSYSRPSQPSTPAISSAAPAHVTAHVNRASASPSIASLIDNPHPSSNLPSTMLSPPSTSNPIVQTTPQKTGNGTTNLSPSPSAARSALTNDAENAMDIDSKPVIKNGVTDKSSEVKAPSKASSAAPTPKPAQPVGTGSGLLSSSDLFGGPSLSDGAVTKGVNIDIQITLDPNGGNHVNVAQEIIKKYGRDALYPRAAQHRERLLQVMAAANKLDGGSADDMSIDLMSEGEGDSNVEMGGIDDERSAADAEKPRKRRKKAEEYDLDDEFIDDTELAWQQQAAVAKDGFFVYSGPLITDAAAARAEAASTGTRGGRGRGRGRGRGGASATTHASFAEKKETTATPSTAATPGRGRGRGRGTGAPRKPRITKADKEKMEAEKASREKAAATIAAAPAVSAPALPTAPSNHAVQVGQTLSTAG